MLPEGFAIMITLNLKLFTEAVQLAMCGLLKNKYHI